MTIQQAVKNNISIASTLRCLGRAIVGSNYSWLKKEVDRLQLDTSHWKGQSHGTSVSPVKYKASELFVDDGKASTGRVKKRILSDKLIPYICANCKCEPIWMGKPLTLRLDHKNGKNNDHRLDNLQFLCPNCDSQSETFCGRNKNKCVSSSIG